MVIEVNPMVNDDNWNDVKQAWNAVEVVPTFPLPDGPYSGEIVSVELLKNGNGTPFFRIGFASWDEKFRGGRAFRDAWINTTTNIAKAKEKFGSFGVTDFDAVTEGGLLGKLVFFGVETKHDGRGPEVSNVRYFVPRNLLTETTTNAEPCETDKIPF